MGENRPQRGQRDPNPNNDHAANGKRSITGDIGVRGKIEVDLPPSLVKEYHTNNKDEDTRENRRFIVEIVTLVFVVIVAFLSVVQTRQAVKSFSQSKSQFIQDQRPYIWHSAVKAATGTTPTRMGVSVYWANYGKSPAIDFKSSGRVFCGQNAVKEAYSFLEGNPNFESVGTVIAPFVPNPPDSPTIGYDGFETEDLKTPDMVTSCVIGTNVVAGKIEYLDIEGAKYTGEFCTGRKIREARGYVGDGNCEKHNGMKQEE